MIDLHASYPLAKPDARVLIPPPVKVDPGKIGHRSHNAKIVEFGQVSNPLLDKHT
jgi:hypothetical protein